MDFDEAVSEAGPAGSDFAYAMADKMIEHIDGYPASSPLQRAAIARVLGNRLDDYVLGQERGAEDS